MAMTRERVIRVAPQDSRRRVSMDQSWDTETIQHVANHALQSSSIAVEQLAGYVFRTFRLQHPRDGFYIMRAQPPFTIALLRLERDRLKIEADVLLSLRGRSDALAPRLIEYHNTAISIDRFYLISGPFRGSILSEVEPGLSSQHLAAIDNSLGRYVSGLSRITSSSFGAVRLNTSLPAPGSWRECFIMLLESVLRDGEDAMLSLPYDVIRDQVRRHRSSLDEITQPRLTLLEMVSDQNIVVDVRDGRVLGILDFSSALWGDPYMSDCFYKPSLSFVEGFGKLPNRNARERIRQYMYITYHSLLAVVRHCYRPSSDGSELDARQNLTSALHQLASLRS